MDYVSSSEYQGRVRDKQESQLEFLTEQLLKIVEYALDMDERVRRLERKG